MILQFGKYKGKEVSSEEIPTSYLLHIFEQYDNDYFTNTMLALEIQRRISVQAKQKNVVLKTNNSSSMLTDIKAIYRKLAIKYHPDKGGSEDAMKAINEFKEAIEDTL